MRLFYGTIIFILIITIAIVGFFWLVEKQDQKALQLEISKQVDALYTDELKTELLENVNEQSLRLIKTDLNQVENENFRTEVNESLDPLYGYLELRTKSRLFINQSENLESLDEEALERLIKSLEKNYPVLSKKDVKALRTVQKDLLDYHEAKDGLNKLENGSQDGFSLDLSTLPQIESLVKNMVSVEARDELKKQIERIKEKAMIYQDLKAWLSDNNALESLDLLKLDSLRQKLKALGEETKELDVFYQGLEELRGMLDKGFEEVPLDKLSELDISSNITENAFLRDFLEESKKNALESAREAQKTFIDRLKDFLGL